MRRYDWAAAHPPPPLAAEAAPIVGDVLLRSLRTAVDSLSGMTVLHVAAMFNSMKAAEWLLKEGDVEVRRKNTRAVVCNLAMHAADAESPF